MGTNASKVHHITRQHLTRHVHIFNSERAQQTLTMMIWTLLTPPYFTRTLNSSNTRSNNFFRTLHDTPQPKQAAFTPAPRPGSLSFKHVHGTCVCSPDSEEAQAQQQQRHPALSHTPFILTAIASAAVAHTTPQQRTHVAQHTHCPSCHMLLPLPSIMF